MTTGFRFKLNQICLCKFIRINLHHLKENTRNFHFLSIPTFKLPLCVEDTQICWYGVKAAAANHIHPFVQSFGVVLQLHTLQELHAKCI